MNVIEQHDRVRRLSAVVILLSCTGILASCSFIEQKLGRSDPQDGVTARSVKASLLESTAVDAAPIRVRVADGEVTLEGFVESEAESQAAEEIVRQNYPDLELINSLQVR